MDIFSEIVRDFKTCGSGIIFRAIQVLFRLSRPLSLALRGASILSSSDLPILAPTGHDRAPSMGRRRSARWAIALISSVFD